MEKKRVNLKLSFSSEAVALFSPENTNSCVPIEATVKWFNLTKGFGFVEPAGGGGDAFLHASVVAQLGLREVTEGARLLVTICDGSKGRQVVSIIKILEQPVAGVPTHAPLPPVAIPTDAIDMAGAVKWYRTGKGFGFITPDGSDRDVFVHRGVLLRAGLTSLMPGQRVGMKVITASKGYEAITLTIL
jgi:CspA family cold shock protein